MTMLVPLFRKPVQLHSKLRGTPRIIWMVPGRLAMHEIEEKVISLACVRRPNVGAIIWFLGLP
jgi:hypothetical protein